jgi:hypothetical protein
MSKAERFLPGFTLAPGDNRAMVTKPSITGEVNFGGHEPSEEQRVEAASSLARKRAVAGPLGSLHLEYDRSLTVRRFGSWADLVYGTAEWLVGRLKPLDWQPLADRLDTDPQAVLWGVIRPMSDGIITMGAIQEVVPRVLACRRFDDPNAEISQWVGNTKRMALEWMALHRDVDPRLAWALSVDKPERTSAFEGLRLHPNYFVADDSVRAVRLDETLVPDLVDREGAHPEAANMPGDALFACPGRELIPHIYDAMRQSARHSGLFAESYWDERAQLGYLDAQA